METDEYHEAYDAIGGELATIDSMQDYLSGYGDTERQGFALSKDLLEVEQMSARLLKSGWMLEKLSSKAYLLFGTDCALPSVEGGLYIDNEHVTFVTHPWMRTRIERALRST